MKGKIYLFVALALLGAASCAYGWAGYSTLGGGNQVWLSGDSFVARSTDGGSPNFVEDPNAAANTLSGHAYYFPRDPFSGPGDQLNWWAEYEIPQYTVPFSLSGQFTFWARVAEGPWVDGHTNMGVDSDWLIVNGDPNDIFPAIASPTDAQWWAALQMDGPTERILNGLVQGSYDLSNYNFAWWSKENPPPTSTLTKTFAVVGGKASFRIYEREAALSNALIDLIVLSSDPNYIPRDGDFEDVLPPIPEPGSIAALSMGLVGLLGLMRRRR